MIEKIECRPSWWGALSGIWGLTWRTHLGWRRSGGLLSTVFAIPVLVFISISEGNTSAFMRWITFHFFLLLPLGCLSSCGGMIREELQADTLGFLLTRPLSRARLLLTKWATQMVWIQALMMAHLLILCAIAGFRSIGEMMALAPLLLAAQVLAIPAWSALSTLLGLISPKYIVFGLIYGFIVEFGIGRIPTNINTLSMTRHLQTLLANNGYLAQLHDWSPDQTTRAIIALLVGTAFFLSLAVLLFTFKEYHHTEEMQK